MFGHCWCSSYVTRLFFRRPRASGDLYAVYSRCGTTDDTPKIWWLWVLAFAGTTDRESSCGLRQSLALLCDQPDARSEALRQLESAVRDLQPLERVVEQPVELTELA